MLWLKLDAGISIAVHMPAYWIGVAICFIVAISMCVFVILRRRKK